MFHVRKLCEAVSFKFTSDPLHLEIQSMRSARRSEITGVKAIAFLSLVLNILLPVSAASNIESETDCASLG
jgi:hypothetical protein